MILKASQRGGGQDLAVHLLRTDDNEHMRVIELRGFASDDLRGAFKEAEAVSRGTKCRQYLFSVSFSPPESAVLGEEDFRTAIDRVEDRMGLSRQPRAIVLHEKEGRRHAHAVWSRIDADTMTAKALPFFKNRLMEVSRELYLDHGWQMPRGMAKRLERDPTNFTLAEWQQAKRMGQDPRWLKTTLQECWSVSDDAKSFDRAIKERGFFLARGDKRGFVVVGHDGEVHSVPRALGLKTKEVAARLGKPDELRSVTKAQEIIGKRMVPAMRRHVEESRDQFRERSAKLGEYKEGLTRLHRKEREEMRERHDAQRLAETKERADRMPRGVRGLWDRVTGRYQQIRSQHEREAKLAELPRALDQHLLELKQVEQRQRLQILFKDLRGKQAEQLLNLREDVGRFFALSRADEKDRSREHGREAGLGLNLER